MHGYASRAADGLRAGAVAALVSGLPSTLYHLLAGRSPLEPVRAAGTLLLPRASPGPLLVAGTVVHVAVSLGWGAVLGVVLPRRATVAWGVGAGLAIAGLDLGLIGRRFPRIRALEAMPQVADHLAYGAVVGSFVIGARSSEAQWLRSDSWSRRTNDAPAAKDLYQLVRSLRSLTYRAGWRGGSTPPRR